MPDCPDDTELAGFLNDSLGAERGACVSGHVDGCPACQARLDRLTEQTSGAVARYRERPVTELPDARSGDGAPPAEADTQIVGARPAVAVFGGPPPVPGFEVLGEIGRGGMGIVFKARHRRLNRLVALKMILSGTSDGRATQRFLFEGEVLARVRHPQVVTVFEVGTYEGPNRLPVPYLAMELLEGGSLGSRLRSVHEGAAERFSPRAAAELLDGLARAVHAAHLQGVVHRDLKPGNILFSAGDAGGAKADSASGSATPSTLHSSGPKVTDFGLAKFTRDSGADLTQTGQVLGTPQYMAPEQAAGARQVGPAADVYALGTILFECLAGRPPFVGTEPMSVMLRVLNDPPPDVRALRPDVPRDLAAVVATCLAKAPERRYPSAEALADDLRRFLDGRPTQARPVTNLERLWLLARRNPAVAGLLAALAATLTVGFVAVAVLWARAEERARTEAGLREFAQAAGARAQEEQRLAQEARARAVAEVEQRQRHEAQLEFARGAEWCEDGRVADGLELFVRAVDLAEATGDAALARVARVNLAAWGRERPKPPRRFRHTEQPRLVAFHPDGKHMVSAGRGREVYLWDLGTGARVRTYRPSFDPVGLLPQKPVYWTVGVSPDGRLVAAGGSDGAVTLWEADPGGPAVAAPLAHFKLPDPKVPDVNLWTLAFTGPRTLWTNDGANGLRRWNLTDPKRPTSERFMPGGGASASTLQILVASPDGRALYTGDRAGRVRAWDAATGAERRSWHVRGWVTDVAVSPDNTRLAAVGTGGTVSVLDLTDDPKDDPSGEKRVLELSLAGAYGNGVAFAPAGPQLVASDGDGNVRCWHRETGQPMGLARQFHGEVTRMRFRPGSTEFAVPAGDSVYLCAAPAPAGELVWAGRRVRTRGLDFAPGGGALAVADDWGCGVIDLRTREARALAFDGEALTVRFDPDPARPRVFRGGRAGLDLFALPGGTRGAGGTSPGGRASRLDFPRGGGGVYALSPLVVARYDPATLKRAAVARPAAKIPAGVELTALAVRPDGGEVFVSFGDSAAVLRGDTLAPLREWAIGDEVLDARYTPDGAKVLLGRRAGAAELRDARSGERVLPLMPHKGAITGVAVAPDGATLVTASRDDTARFWDAATGLPLGPPLVHAGPVTHVAYAPDGRRIATGTGDGHITLWDAPPPPLAAPLGELKATFGGEE
ncbi:protein kinase [Gemmata sp. JC673]|uniref:Protein kinase n=1 Tax=Gemmata algarum TaxID=2975278 RepID=A0ABU5F1Y6_9BACT|nr:protein kinase [Gemmata algarum]MDY3561143.1 protein kinase [Gemmata algarum]